LEYECGCRRIAAAGKQPDGNHRGDHLPALTALADDGELRLAAGLANDLARVKLTSSKTRIRPK
jgi:hypothetical protein